MKLSPVHVRLTAAPSCHDHSTIRRAVFRAATVVTQVQANGAEASSLRMPSAEMGADADADAGVRVGPFEYRRYGHVSPGYVEALRAEVESPRSLVRSAVTTLNVPARTVTLDDCRHHFQASHHH